MDSCTSPDQPTRTTNYAALGQATIRHEGVHYSLSRLFSRHGSLWMCSLLLILTTLSQILSMFKSSWFAPLWDLSEGWQVQAYVLLTTLALTAHLCRTLWRNWRTVQHTEREAVPRCAENVRKAMTWNERLDLTAEGDLRILAASYFKMSADIRMAWLYQAIHYALMAGVLFFVSNWYNNSAMIPEGSEIAGVALLYAGACLFVSWFTGRAERQSVPIENWHLVIEDEAGQAVRYWPASVQARAQD